MCAKAPSASRSASSAADGLKSSTRPVAAPSPPADSALDTDPGHLFSHLNDAKGIVVAVSGGPDSIALMHLLARWDLPSRPQIIVATVDHGLRPEAAEEAAFVSREAVALGFTHRILTWTGEKPQTGLQEAAREARYRLLVQCAREAGASHLLTAHTLDDQAETIMMRLARGSGLKGLAGMRGERDREGISHARPLLDLPKTALLDLCRENAWSFITDPSNANERFARVRWRALLPLLAAEGLTAARLARLAERVAQADEALDAKARDALADAKPEHDGNAFSFDAACLADEPFEIALRVLALALERIGLPLDNARLARLETGTGRLRGALRAGEGLRMTLAGALIELDRTGRLVLSPEPPRSRGR
jgi:tRNA(Ile)-lysidine synthase